MQDNNNNQDNYKFADLSVTNSDHRLNYHNILFTAHYENSSWKFTIIYMIGYALQPIALPIMIFFSRLLKRKMEWFPTEEYVK